jgi:hypothetical protein
MKRTLALLLVSALFPGAARAQATAASHVPEVVRKAFQARFPAVKRTEWKLKSDRNYEAEFTLEVLFRSKLLVTQLRHCAHRAWAASRRSLSERITAAGR